MTKNTKREQHDFVVGVPCSRLDGFTSRIKDYIPCTREDEAMALAVGSYLVGKKPLVFLQNSGLGNIVDITTSLLRPYGIEIELLVSVRNQPEHHVFMGKITEELLELLEYKNYRLFLQ